jgi:hypothetical protein
MRPTLFHVFAVDRVGRVLSVSAGATASLKSGYVVTPASESLLGCVSP